ncbi:MAG: hypothetical protein GY941_17150 [Planctomycetes bacterium]|nr:hypothetical protein [Planctomycetota bacterium]
MRKKLGYLLSLWKNNPWNKLYFMLLFLIPVPIVILSITLFYRLPCIYKTTQEIRHSLQNRYEIEREKVNSSDKKMEIAVNNWDGFKKKIPDSYEAVSSLIIGLNKFASSRGFQMSYTLGDLKPVYSGATDLSLLPINLNLNIKKIGTDQIGSLPVGLVQFVELLHDIVEGYYSVDLSGVVVKGTGKGIRVMDVSINLWVAFGSELAISNEV